MGVLADTGLGLKIKAALLFDGHLDGRDIAVRAQDGTVWLAGSVRYQSVRELVEGVALRNGAHDVVNGIRVVDPEHRAQSDIIPRGFPPVSAPSGAEPVTEPSLEEQVIRALRNDARVNGHLISVHAENGIVYLTGRQDNVVERDAATETASHVPGVYGVINNVEVLPSI